MADDIRLLLGDCLERMAELPPASCDAVVTDPPYGLSFLGREWDHGVPGVPFWRAALRVAKPGAHLLAFGGSRTSHRLACAIEDAGWEIRDTLCWLYGQGMPKGIDISKAIDRMAGAEREVVGSRRVRVDLWTQQGRERHAKGEDHYPIPLTAPATDAAREWDGWHTGLKPAHEPIILARAPFRGPVAANVLAHGCGALNVGATRIGYSGARDMDRARVPQPQFGAGGNTYHMQAGTGRNGEMFDPSPGRYPPNVILQHTPECRCVGTRKVAYRTRWATDGWGRSSDENYRMGNGGQCYTDPDGTETIDAWECSDECPVRLLDEQAGERRPGERPARSFTTPGYKPGWHPEDTGERIVLDSGGASRFMYCCKASPGERGDHNTHPCVKPLMLMRWLVKLVTRPGGLVLDPFCGSGSTLLACLDEGMRCVGIDSDADSVAIARRRLADHRDLTPLFDREGVAHG